jgi:hypothetical protein
MKTSSAFKKSSGLLLLLAPESRIPTPVQELSLAEKNQPAIVP